MFIIAFNPIKTNKFIAILQLNNINQNVKILLKLEEFFLTEFIKWPTTQFSDTGILYF
ncbi:MAG: hypothetical protein ACEY3J_03635 [Arsenophonus sp.]